MFTLLNQTQKYMETVFAIPKTEWFSDNEIIFEDESIIVRCFRTGNHIKLFVPPQAGHDSTIVDYDDKQSLIQTTLKNTSDGIYAIEWKSCTYERRNESIEDLVFQVKMAIDKSRIHSKILGPIDLIGLCMGGWLSSIVNCIYPKDINTLIVAGSPINTGVDREKSSVCRLVDITPQIIYEHYVLCGGGRMSGAFMLAGWKMSNFFDRYVNDYIDIWNVCQQNEESTLSKIKKFRNWYEKVQDLAGNWYLTVVDEIFRKNNLYKGNLYVDGRRINFNEIQNKIISVAGSKDDITPINQAFGHKDSDKHVIDDCGHIGLFMGRKSQKTWKEIFTSMK